MMRPLPALSESPRLRAFTFFALYVVEGIPSGFALTAVANYLTAQHLDPGVIGAFAARIGIPWSVQFVWGPIIDRFQGSPMGRRKPWVLGAQVAASFASLGLLAISDPVAQVGLMSIAFLIHGLFASIQDASVDAMAISLIPEAERGRVNAFMRAGLMVGSGMGMSVWAVLLHRFGFFEAALAQSLTLMAMAGLTAFLRERPGDALVPWGRRAADPDDSEPEPEEGPSPGIGWVFAELMRGFFAPRSFSVFLVVLSVYTGMSVFIRAYYWHLIHVLGWSDEYASVFSGTYGTPVGLGIALMGAGFADRIGTRRLMVLVMGVIATFLVVFGSLGAAWVHPNLARAGLMLWFSFDPAFSVACMPVLMGLCRPGVEGSQFTAYMALVNLANVAGTYASGLAQRSISAPTIGLACGLAIAATIPLAIPLLRAKPRPPKRADLLS